MDKYSQRHDHPLLVHRAYLQHKTYKCSRTRRSCSAFFRAFKSLHLGVLVHVFTARNGLVLTETCSPPPGASATQTLQTLENAAVLFSVLSGVQKPAFRCVSTCIHLAKWPGTHGDMFTPSWCISATQNLQTLKNAAVLFSVLLHVEKPAFRCVSTHNYLTKGTSTHRDLFNPFSWPGYSGTYKKSK
jgi:hypothetical protein